MTCLERSKDQKFRVIRMYTTLSYLAKIMYDELPTKTPQVSRGIAKEDFDRLEVIGEYDGVVPVTVKEANDLIRMTYTQNGRKRNIKSVQGIGKVLNRIRQS